MLVTEIIVAEDESRWTVRDRFGDHGVDRTPILDREKRLRHGELGAGVGVPAVEVPVGCHQSGRWRGGVDPGQELAHGACRRLDVARREAVGTHAGDERQQHAAIDVSGEVLTANEA